jgi:hypothetical protein
MQTPQKGNGQRPGHPSSQVRTGNPNSQGNRGQQNYMHGRVNHVTAEEAQGDKDVMLGTFLINYVHAIVLFDYGASH